MDQTLSIIKEEVRRINTTASNILSRIEATDASTTITKDDLSQIEAALEVIRTSHDVVRPKVREVKKVVFALPKSQ